jgi:hypothetical protein
MSNDNDRQYLKKGEQEREKKPQLTITVQRDDELIESS